MSATIALLIAAGLFNCMPGIVELAGKPVTMPVSVPSAGRAVDLVLLIEGVQVNPERGAILRVFAELPEANRSTSVDDSHFLGHVTLMARAGPQSKTGANMVLNVPAQAEKWLRGKRSVRITLVPMSDGQVKIGNVRLAPAKG